MFDINTLIHNAITAAINEAVEVRMGAFNQVLQAHANIIDGLAKRILELEEKLSAVGVTSPEVNMDALRELVTPLVASIVVDKIDSVVEQAIEDHCEGYDHDSYDNAVNKLDDLPDFDDFLTKDDIEDAVKDAVENLTFEVSVS